MLNIVWWLPTTYFEDLGRARRISRYQVKETGPFVHHIASCYVLADGNKEEMRTRRDESDYVLDRNEALEFLKEKIRRRYPRR
jgi:hypothetical protein